MTPTSTYRLQLGPDLDLDDVAAIVPSLAALGIEHLHLSPVLGAVPGSTHGYDVVDHAHVRAELGGRAALERLRVAAAAVDVGLVLDIVPNHMSIAEPVANRWWWDVLENGPSSPWAGHFDVAWESVEARQLDTVLLPILGDHYGVELESGALELRRRSGSLVVGYHDHVFPLAPRSLVGLLRPVATASVDDRVRTLVEGLAALPRGTASIARRHDELEELRTRLAAVLGDETVAAAVDAHLHVVNADPDQVHEVLEQQHYQLCHWRRARHDLDYRRFFDIDTLIGLRMEDPAVFRDTHALVLELVADGTIDGLRIDHPDGLTDPAGYLAELADASGGTWTVVEKILEHGEHLRDTWPVAGTTGYDFLRAADGVFRSPAGVDALTSWWDANVDATPWRDVVAEAKGQIVRTVLAADVARVVDIGVRLCEHQRRHRDHTRHDLTQAVRALLVAMPVYRTYVTAGMPLAEADRDVLDEALAGAALRDADVDADLFGFLGRVLAGDHPEDPRAVEFVQRFQQLTGPAMAKSVEDTAFYRRFPVAAANEVGGEPGHPVVSIAEFHDHQRHVQAHWPTTTTTLSTHDTKRSADVRSRLDALTASPDRWLAFLDRWVGVAVDRWRVDADVPTTVLALQTLVGAWPIDQERLGAYLEKATKEAKVRTSWIDPDPDFDRALRDLVHDLLDDPTFVQDLTSLVDDVTVPGRRISVAKQLLLLTCPGVPDVYQGSELWDLSLVDPDNRRPVDHGLRARLADGLARDDGPGVGLADDEHGVHKLWVTGQALRLRRDRPASFGPGDAGAYVPIDAGPDVVAFRRGDDVVVAVQVGPTGTGDVPLPAGRWHDLLTGADHQESVTVDAPRLLVRAR